MYKIMNNQLPPGPVAVITILIVAISASVAFSATVNVRIQSDKDRYHVGDTVSWTVYAWSNSPLPQDQYPNRGISFLSIHLDDDTADAMMPPFIDALDTEFLNSDFGVADNFEKLADGTPQQSPPDVWEISVTQQPFNRHLEVANDDWNGHVLAHGSYTVTVLGEHTITPIYYATGAQYWVDATGPARPFETKNTFPASFTVVLKADINTDYYVNIADYAMLSARWKRADCADSDDCDGADINSDGIVDFVDLASLATQWLSCTDPDNPFCDQFWQ